MKKNTFEFEAEEKDEKRANYMALGMCFGAMAGSVGLCILAMFGKIAWGGLSVGIGLLAGMLIGMAIPKK